MITMENNEKKVVHFHIYEPHNSIFKNKTNEKAVCSTVACSMSERCGLFKKKECSYISPIGWQACPYGKYKKEIGPTRRAQKYHSWISSAKAKHEGVPSLRMHTSVMCEVGDHVFLPYAHIAMNESVPFLAKGGFMLKENVFLKKEDFTIDNIKRICSFVPYSLMGGAIDSYQKEEVPKFLVHLYEQFPDLYKELCETYPRAKDIVISHTNVGRKAILQTLNPNVGEFIDIHKSSWAWDGTHLISTNSRASFMLVSKFKEIKLLPEDEVEVIVTDDKQVNENTKFLS